MQNVFTPTDMLFWCNAHLKPPLYPPINTSLSMSVLTLSTLLCPKWESLSIFVRRPLFQTTHAATFSALPIYAATLRFPSVLMFTLYNYFLSSKNKWTWMILATACMPSLEANLITAFCCILSRSYLCLHSHCIHRQWRSVQ